MFFQSQRLECAYETISPSSDPKTLFQIGFIYQGIIRIGTALKIIEKN